MFSKACEYAIKAAIYVAKQSLRNELVNVKQVAVSVDAPVAFTAKILQRMNREKILESSRGKMGGFVFNEEKQKGTTIYDIVILFDGPGVFTECGLGLHRCSALNPCPVHDDFKIVREKLQIMTQKFSFFDLAVRTESGLAWLR
ncbi:Rrf2 family transcriptional regulator [Kaistella sp. PBT33-4]|uniref:RrF2 family transcriptional regulator n=1 Tax=Kaistella sp. PBT33-4 TaxID=3032000 RepID=UPI0023D7DE29|nr:Rrf2 family transcriptional regulator [Kaistella sp. PBT33-4]MDF0718623.1 Rrf2 family transcriptional regulator [Kaistella sp. PBT33-4]